MPKCWNCSSEIGLNQFARLDTCDHCGKDTHVCKNCIHYDRAFNNECRESQADRQVEKEKSNFCDYFKPSDRAGGLAQSKDAMKSAADALFGSSSKASGSDSSPSAPNAAASKDSASAPIDAARAAAEALFKKK